MNRSRGAVCVIIIGFVIIFPMMSPVLANDDEGSRDTNTDPTSNFDGGNSVIKTRSNTIVVDQGGSGDYTKIQDAINNSATGDIIHIMSGTFLENLTINNSITIKGEGSENTVIHVQDGFLMNISADNFHLSNITVKNDNGMGIEFSGKNIRLENLSFFCANGIRISNNNFCDIINCYFDCIHNSLLLHNSPSSNILIMGNNFSGISGVVNIQEFKLYGGNDIRMVQNYFEDIGRVLFCTYTFNKILIKDNYFIEIGEPIDIGRMENIIRNITVDNNLFTTGGGSTISYSENIVIKNNRFINNQGGANDGVIVISDSKDITIFNNNISNNENTGIRIENSDEINIYNNHFFNNEIGLVIDQCNHKTIWKNTFIDNTIHASDASVTTGWNGIYPTGGNYWSDYIGKDVMRGSAQSDVGSDGFGDTPYTNDHDVKDRYPIFVDILKPYADAGIDATIGLGTVYHFNPEKSYDDQIIMRYLWEWDYNGDQRKIELKEFDFQFDEVGMFQINLTVFDFTGNNDTDSINITVIDQEDPIAASQGNITINQGEIAYLNGTGSTDNDIIVNYTWHIDIEDEWFGDFFGHPLILKLDDPGMYTVGLRVTDRSGNTGFEVFFIEVVDIIDPVADAGNDIIVDNWATVDFDGSGCTDNWGEWYNFDYNWSFRYVGETIYLQGHSPSFTFDIPGYYNVTMIVFDHWGNSDMDYVIVTVVDTIQPIAKISGSLTVLEGEQLSLSGLDSTDNVRIVKYLWTFNDTEPMEKEGPFLNYSFVRKGLIEVTLTVVDQWNNSNSIRVTINVEDSTSPYAIAGEDSTINIGDTITLNGSGSNDNEIIVRWEWSFTYAGENKILTGEIVNFTFDVPGEFSILLTVYDQSNNIGEDRIIIIVIGSDDDDNIIGDDDTIGKEKEFPVFVVIMIGVIVLIITIGLVVFLLMRKKRPEEEHPAKEEKDDLEKTLPPEEHDQSEQEPIAPPEPEIIQEEEDVLGPYDLPETSPISITDKSKEE